VVLYEESLNETVLEKSVEAIESADMLIVGGTSLVVYPAAGLVRYFRGKHLVVINMSPTSLDKNADLLIDEKIGEVFSKLK
jgi:NAD-dependent deacetylase